MKPKENRILARLSASAYHELQPSMEFVLMPAGEVLSGPDDPHQHIYFPVTAMVGLLNSTDSGESTELALVGREGLIGISLFTGGMSTNSRAVVLSGGYGYRIDAAVMHEEFIYDFAFQALVLRFIQALSTQVFQGAVCAKHHSLTQQFCSWLLMCLDRMTGNELRMTQKVVSEVLGVRRESISEIAHTLREQGSIEYTRGRIVVPDRVRLEECACECYGVIKREYDRLL